MTKTQVTNVIGRLPIVPLWVKVHQSKQAKTEPRKSELAIMTATTQETATRGTDVTEQERTTEVQVTPGMLPVVEVDTNLEEEIDIEKDAEMSKRATKTTSETGIEQYNRYVLSGKGEISNKKLMRQSRI